MADMDKARRDAVAQFWSQLGRVRAGMLWVEGAAMHPQPMAHHADPEAGRLWFVTDREAEIVEAVGAAGAAARYAVVGDNHDWHAAVAGPLEQSRDAAALAAVWSPVTAAWFDGVDDPRLILLRLTLREGMAWASTGDPARFAWEIAKARLVDDDPEIGVRAELAF